jgi:hypothetical protein
MIFSVSEETEHGPSQVKVESEMILDEDFADPDLIPIQIKNELEYYEHSALSEGTVHFTDLN